MTANQIAYAKYLEDVRHNMATEEMERPVKQALAYQYLTTGDLNKAKLVTESLNQDILNIQKEYQPALYASQIEANRANAAAGYATANAQNAAAYNYTTQAALNLRKADTEYYNTQLVSQQAQQAEWQAKSAASNYEVTKVENTYKSEALYSDVGSSLYSMSYIFNTGNNAFGVLNTLSKIVQ